MSGCHVCVQSTSRISWAHDELARLARRASAAKNGPSAALLDALAAARNEKADQEIRLREHRQQEHPRP